MMDFRGAFSIVKLGVNKKTGRKLAIKYIEKKFVDEKHIEQLRREIDIMKKVDHVNVRLLSFFSLIIVRYFKWLKFSRQKNN